MENTEERIIRLELQVAEHDKMFKGVYGLLIKQRDILEEVQAFVIKVTNLLEDL